MVWRDFFKTRLVHLVDTPQETMDELVMEKLRP